MNETDSPAPELLESGAEPNGDEQFRRRLVRRSLIEEYEAKQSCRFIAFSGDIASFSALFFEQILSRFVSNEDVHLLLNTLGGDPEAAIRLVRQVRSRCQRLTIVVPHQAKSAGTLLVLGADEVIIGPTSDLGPVDPQVWLKGYGRMSAKSVVSAFEHAEAAALRADETAAFLAMTLANRSAIDAQQACDAIAHTGVQLRQALANDPARDENRVEKMATELESVLITEPQSHAATISGSDLKTTGLPIRELEALDPDWSSIWDLWIRFTEMPENQIYESADVSIAFHLDPDE